LFKNGPDSIKA